MTLWIILFVIVAVIFFIVLAAPVRDEEDTIEQAVQTMPDRKVYTIQQRFRTYKIEIKLHKDSLYCVRTFYTKGRMKNVPIRTFHVHDLEDVTDEVWRNIDHMEAEDLKEYEIRKEKLENLSRYDPRFK